MTRHPKIALPILSLLAATLAACGGGSDADDTGADAGADGGGFGPASLDDVDVTWTPCPLYEGAEGADGGLAECATVEMPLFWDADDGRTFQVRAKRLLAPGESTGQLWLLHGGPGASGVIDFPPWMEQIAAAHPALDVYTLDPRGTGYSEYASCPNEEAATSAGGAELLPSEAPACAEHLESQLGDRLSVMGTTSAAMDLAALIHHTREDGKRVLVWGGSGGTFWANRYLLMYPDGADGVILEGIEPADGSLVFQDEYSSEINEEILSRCADDAVCGVKLPDPTAELTALYGELDAGHCPIGVDSLLLAQLLDYLVYYHPFNAFVPSIVYRLERCDSGDIDAIVHLFNALFPTETGESLPSFSSVLFYNETCSEIWDHSSFADNGALVDYLDGVYMDDLVPTEKGYARNEICQAWPKYEDARDDLFAATDVPLLMLEGELDPATPHAFATELEALYTGPHQTFVTMPSSGHNVNGGAPTATGDCGAELFDAFLEDPTAPLDTSCVGERLPLDFEGGYGYAPYLYGTADCFENVSAKARGALPPVLRLRLEEIGRQLARALGRTPSVHR
jgi:pimeloyl-ACP methyl ester carboxylesterase